MEKIKPKKRRVLSLIIAMIMVISAVNMTITASAEEAAEETQADVTISTADELKAFRDEVNNGNNFSGKTIELANDIDLNGESWESIGWYSNSYNNAVFGGTFDGKGHKITGLNVTSNRDDVYYGLFGYVDGGSIINLQVEGEINVSYTEGFVYAGGIVGNLGFKRYSAISNCSFKGEISVGSAYIVYAGGITGYIDRYSSVSNCWADADISVNGGGTHIGGIAGGMNSSNMTNCYALNNGTVTGVYGYGYGTVTNSDMVSEDEFKSGKVAYDLNENDGVDDVVWYQNIDTGEGADEYPTLDSSHGTVYSYGNGTYGNVTTQISTVKELKAFRDDVNNGNDFSGVTIELMNDIDLNGESWEPIGWYISPTNNAMFSGTFDGKGHKITGLYVTSSRDDTNYGLFGWVEGGSIKNLQVEGEIDAAGGNEGETNAGGIAGIVSNSDIYNCSSYGTITANGERSANAGGIAGRTASASIISNCSFEGKITAASTDEMYCVRAGGIIGFIYTDSSVSNCWAAADIQAGNENVSNHIYMGGIAGQMSTDTSKMTNCYGLTTDNITDICGMIDRGQVSNCAMVNEEDFKSGKVAYDLNGNDGVDDVVWYQNIDTGEGADEYPTLDSSHGVVQLLYEGKYYNNVVLINDLEELEGVRDYINNSDDKGEGMTFRLTNDIDMSEKYSGSTSWYTIGRPSDGNTLNFKGTFDGNGHNINIYINSTSISRQGLFGAVGPGAVVKNLSISGSVTSLLDYTGSIAGVNYGTIENCYSTADVTGAVHTGGIVGSSAGIVKNCYSTGKVDGTSNVSGIVYNGTVSNCYYLDESGTSGSDAEGQAVAKTASAFSGGEVAYLLNENDGIEETVWYQTIGTDVSPVLDSSHGTVYLYGNGTYGNVTTKISTAEELKAFRDAVNNGNDFSGVTIELMNDIDLNGESWESIGWYSNSYNNAVFGGTFDGKGHKITGLYVTSNRDDVHYGLFGYVDGGSIINLQVEGEINVSYTEGFVYAGGIVGNLGLERYSAISNCSFKGEISVGSAYIVYAGGITGYIDRYSSVSNCWADADISANGRSNTHIGGIAGEMNSSNMANCYGLSRDTVTGVYGYGYGTVTNSAMVSEDEFKSGKVAYDLNEKDGTEDTVWYQNIDGESPDTYPVLTGDKGTEVYKVTFNVSDSESETGYSVYSEDYVNYNCNADIPQDPTGENMVFTGWSTSTDGLTDSTKFDGNTAVTGDINVYAVFENAFDGEGEGTEESPYIISKLEELENFRNYINNSSDRGKGEYFKLTGDIDMSQKYGENAKSWEPVGKDYDGAFAGVFDGDGHSIKGLYINSADKYTGLFGCTGESAVIKNLHAEGSINVSTDEGYGSRVGGIAVDNYGKIENCSFKGDITVVNNSSNSGACGGGITAFNSGTISGCYYDGEISIEIGSGTAYGGGIAGDNSGVITNCFNKDNISVKASTTSDSSAFAGGISGYNSIEISNCYNTGNVSAEASNDVQYGVIAGYGSGATASNCYYLEGISAGRTDFAEAKTTGEFADGSVTYLLNGSENSEDNPWKQTLGSDDYPVFEGLNVVGFTKSSEDNTLLYGNEVTDGSVTITEPAGGVFSVVVDTAKFGGEDAKYLESVNVLLNDASAAQITNYAYTDESEQYAGFGVNYTGSQDYVIRGMAEAKDSSDAEKIMYYVTKAVTAPAYQSEKTEE